MVGALEMKSIQEICNHPKIKIISTAADGFNAEIHMWGWDGSVVCSTGAGWEHVSVAPYKKRNTPTWSEMCQIKDIFWNEDEAVIQIHPPKADYVNNVENCLHLWRCTYKEMVLPPSILVGLREGQSPEDIKREIKEAYEMAGETYTG